MELWLNFARGKLSLRLILNLGLIGTGLLLVDTKWSSHILVAGRIYPETHSRLQGWSLDICWRSKTSKGCRRSHIMFTLNGAAKIIRRSVGEILIHLSTPVWICLTLQVSTGGHLLYLCVVRWVKRDRSCLVVVPKYGMPSQWRSTRLPLWLLQTTCLLRIHPDLLA